MTRYATVPPQPRADWDDALPLLPDLHCPENQPVKTGLVDARGNDIWRMPNPIGFGRDREW